jgi:two-component system NtrC family sensor kinase
MLVFTRKRIRSLLPTGQLVLFVCLVSLAMPVHAQSLSVIDNAEKPVSIGAGTSILIDSSNHYSAQTVTAANGFVRSTNNIPIFPVVDGTIWVKFSLLNRSADSILFVDLQYSNISYIAFYKQEAGLLTLVQEGGNASPFDPKKQVSPNYIYRVPLAKGDSATYFLQIRSKHQVLLPLFVENRNSIDASMSLQELVIGLYMGIMLAIFLYNLFLYFSTRDTSYFVYVLYLLFLAVAQVTLAGYGFKYFWPGYPAVNDHALIITSSLAGITGITFALYFLRIRYYTPKLTWILLLLLVIYAGGIVLSFMGLNSISYNILNSISLLGGLILLSASWYIARKKHYKPAYFYFVAWVAFLGGMIIFVLRNFNILPYNNFTTYILYVGSAIEGILLSIALADKINSLRQEKEKSQAEALAASLENEKLVRDQNIMLERKVSERTEELQASNTNLSTALQDLKDTQIQLVEAEKMASLGQLTAGIAHEINNPINFVKSNIKPLQMDIKDLLEVIDEYDKLHATDNDKIPEHLQQIDKLKKQIDIDYVKSEIDNLMKGIQDGAERTAEIVLGLRNFSRLDESDIKTVNIHEGLDSTLIILKNQVPDHVKIIRDFQANGTIECLPGKLNQVFMNIMSNGLQAIKEKPVQGEEESLTISTRDIDGGQIEIHIKDSGVGMTEEVKHKIFDPFFTTKDVGEGTGLGLSIVFKIIQRHEGKIEVVSSPGNGAEFIITLFHTLPESAIT